LLLSDWRLPFSECPTSLSQPPQPSSFSSGLAPLPFPSPLSPLPPLLHFPPLGSAWPDILLVPHVVLMLSMKRVSLEPRLRELNLDCGARRRMAQTFSHLQLVSDLLKAQSTPAQENPKLEETSVVIGRRVNGCECDKRNDDPGAFSGLLRCTVREGGSVCTRAIAISPAERQTKH